MKSSTSFIQLVYVNVQLVMFLQKTPYPLTATVISSDSIQEIIQMHKEEQTERKDIFDYSEETITQFTRGIKPKSLAFDDQVRVHQPSDEQDSDNEDYDVNSSQHERENE